MAEQHKFLGRTLNPNTMTYKYGDGSGKLPLEAREDVLSAKFLYGTLVALLIAWRWKDKPEGKEVK